MTLQTPHQTDDFFWSPQGQKTEKLHIIISQEVARCPLRSLEFHLSIFAASMMKIVQLMMLLSMWAVWPTIAQELTDKSSNSVSNPNNDPGAHQEANIQSKMTNLRQEKRSLELISIYEDTYTSQDVGSQDVGSDTWSRLLFPLFSGGMSAPSTKKKRSTGFEASGYIGHNGGRKRNFGNGSATVPKRKRTPTTTRKKMSSVTKKMSSMTKKMRTMTKKMRAMTKKMRTTTKKMRTTTKKTRTTTNKNIITDEMMKAPAAPSESTVGVPTPLLQPDVSPSAPSAPTIDLAP